MGFIIIYCYTGFTCNNNNNNDNNNNHNDDDDLLTDPLGGSSLLNYINYYYNYLQIIQ